MKRITQKSCRKTGIIIAGLQFSIYGRAEGEQKERVKFALCASKARVWNRQRIEKDNNSEAAHSLKPRRRKRRGPVAPPEGGCCAGSRNYSYFSRRPVGRSLNS